MPFTLPPLPFDSDALEPNIDKQTMEIHHGKHHAAYVNNLNAAIQKQPELDGKPLHEILANTLAMINKQMKTPGLNNGGAPANLYLLGEILIPAVKPGATPVCK